MANKLNGKVVIITGASSGIGAAMAREYTAMGAKVVLGARQGDKLEQMCKEIEAAGGKAAWCVTDVTKQDDCQKLIQTAVDSFGGIDDLAGACRFIMSLGSPSQTSVYYEEFGRVARYYLLFSQSISIKSSLLCTCISANFLDFILSV